MSLDLWSLLGACCLITFCSTVLIAEYIVTCPKVSSYYIWCNNKHMSIKGHAKVWKDAILSSDHYKPGTLGQNLLSIALGKSGSLVEQARQV